MLVEKKKKRIEYIDALRGLAILLVVSQHVSTFSLGTISANVLGSFLVVFRMPLFFFISGFVLYKANFAETISSLFKFINKKALVQLLPTVVFFLLYCFVRLDFSLESINKYLMEPKKEGYWFTYMLWTFYVVYAFASYGLKKLRIEKWLWIIWIAALIVCAYRLNIGYSLVERYLSAKLFYLYFQFFVFGLLVRKYFHSFERMLENRFAIFTLQIGLVITYILKYTLDVDGTDIEFRLYSTVTEFILPYLCIVFIFALFRRYEYIFSKNHKVGITLQYFGKRTLDIYLIHYFFLFNCPWISKFVFSCEPIFVPELVCNLIITAMVVGCTLCTSYVLRSSNITKYYLFGRR